ncbi:CAP domain-containing protein [Nocardioides sp. GCM10027113]|uniref:CAP domain-containing protein n=1 Tax=unclassified Nocardioides TaxID=2615069 RepID=UPI0036099BDE
MALAVVRTSIAAVVAAVLASTLVAVPLAPAAHASEAGDYARQAFKVTNNKRDKHDLADLRRMRCLQKAARRHAKDMAEAEMIWHQDIGQVMRDCGLDRVGENVAAGYPTGRAVVRAWMRSPGHRRNILNDEFERMGLAARKGDDGRWYAAQVFGRKA